MSVQSRPARNPVVLDANGNVRSFYGVPVTLTVRPEAPAYAREGSD